MPNASPSVTALRLKARHETVPGTVTVQELLCRIHAEHCGATAASHEFMHQARRGLAQAEELRRRPAARPFRLNFKITRARARE